MAGGEYSRKLLVKQSKEELKAICRNWGIRGYSVMTKHLLIVLILDWQTRKAHLGGRNGTETALI